MGKCFLCQKHSEKQKAGLYNHPDSAGSLIALYGHPRKGNGNYSRKNHSPLTCPDIILPANLMSKTGRSGVSHGALCPIVNATTLTTRAHLNKALAHKNHRQRNRHQNCRKQKPHLSHLHSMLTRYSISYFSQFFQHFLQKTTHFVVSFQHLPQLSTTCCALSFTFPHF